MTVTMKKIIQILCHTTLNNRDLYYHVYGGFGSRLAKKIKKANPDLSVESWMTVVGLDKKRNIDKDGIKYRLFPAHTLSKFLESFFAIIHSEELFADLEKEDPKNTIIHFQGERGTLLYQLLYYYPQYSTVLQYHGYGQPPWLDWLERILFTPFEKKLFPRIKHFFVPIKPRISYLTNLIKIDLQKISHENIGIDFKLFKPGNKKTARKKLSLPQKAFILIYVGPLIASKGVKKIVEAYLQLKQKYPLLFLLFVGANQTDPLYDFANKHADKIVGLVNNSQIPLYYNSADLLCFYGNEKIKKFSGPGIAPTEALVTNLNVLSTNLFHFPDKIMNKIGSIPKNEADFSQKIEFFITHPEFKFNSREIVRPYTSYEFQIANLLKIYKLIF